MEFITEWKEAGLCRGCRTDRPTAADIHLHWLPTPPHDRWTKKTLWEVAILPKQCHTAVPGLILSNGVTSISSAFWARPFPCPLPPALSSVGPAALEPCRSQGALCPVASTETSLHGGKLWIWSRISSLGKRGWQCRAWVAIGGCPADKGSCFYPTAHLEMKWNKITPELSTELSPLR